MPTKKVNSLPPTHPANAKQPFWTVVFEIAGKPAAMAVFTADSKEDAQAQAVKIVSYKVSKSYDHTVQPESVPAPKANSRAKRKA